jgi:electron-transferring-flavoprotein dehydrogenase
VASLGRLVGWLAAKAEAEGVNVFCEFPGAELLIEQGRVVGVRTGDKGLDRQGRRKPNFEPGVDLMAKLTILGEGPRGTLSKRLIDRFQLDRGREPQVYAIGIKELWELPDDRFPAGKVVHTMGWPLRAEEFGGGFLYGMQGRILDLGFVAGLDYHDPLFDPHRELQRFKTHPFIAKLLAGGKLIAYGAKAIPEGGLWAMPQPYAAGALLIGDSGGFLNAMRLKGIHLAMKSGMLAAETALEALVAGAALEERLAGYERRIRASWAYRELHRVRNFHQGFEHGMLAGLVNAGLMMVTGGRGFGLVDRLAITPGHLRMRTVEAYYRNRPLPAEPPRFDGRWTFDKLTDLYSSGTKHLEDQPCHLRIADFDICNRRCVVEYQNPCQRFCPASVYEMVSDQSGAPRLHLNPSNCVHCKTCDIMDPYQIITWVPPEGGGGPAYSGL